MAVILVPAGSGVEVKYNEKQRKLKNINARQFCSTLSQIVFKHY